RSGPASARPTGGRRCPAAPLPHQCPRSTVPRSSSYGSLPARPCTMRALVAQATVRALGGRDVTTLAHPRPLRTQGSSGLPRPTAWTVRSSAAQNQDTRTQGSSGLPRPTAWTVRSSAAQNQDTRVHGHAGLPPSPSPPKGEREERGTEG